MANSFIIKRFFSSSNSCFNNVFNHITIIGGGLMGSGIAQVTAQSGMDVTIVEVDEEAVKKSDANIKKNIQRVAKKLFQNSAANAEKYIAESMGRLKISSNLEEAVAGTDLVVEAIVENIEAKHSLFSRIDSIAPEHTIFASNTSSLPITEIAVVTNRKDRFGGLHFFNPVPVMKLLEVIRTKDTSEETYQKMLAWGKAIGKTTITCKDTPGFVVNRLLVPYLAEAARMLERGDATAKDIDIAMKLGAGYPMGPLELLDYVGLDTTKFILDGWHKKYPENPLFTPIGLLEKLVSEGKLGKKSGEGFYSYKKHSGKVQFATHSPYFQPMLIFNKPQPTPDPTQPPVEAPVEKEKFSEEKVKKLKDDVAKFVENIDDSQKKAKVERPEKLRRMEKLKSLEKWKNSEEFVKANNEKNYFEFLKKHHELKKDRKSGHHVSQDVFNPWEKVKHLKDFFSYEKKRVISKSKINMMEQKLTNEKQFE